MSNPSSNTHKSYVIVVGNEKGGAGKTTSAMHLISSLLELGFKVASIDVDCRQLSISRYIENRKNTAAKKNIELPISDHYIMENSKLTNIADIEKEETEKFLSVIETASVSNDFIVIDTPGSNSFLSRLAHSYADTIITPINDSFVDLDVLAKVEAETLKIERPSIYSQMVWEQKMQRARRDQGVINWLVMRNRLSTIDAKNKRNMAMVLDKLAQRIGFRVATGFGERVIFRELFLQGITLLDLKGNKAKQLGLSFTMAHVVARQELREFLRCLQITKITEAVTTGKSDLLNIPREIEHEELEIA